MACVLVVGDETSARLLQVMLSRMAGDEIEHVRTVEQAYARCAEDPPDLVIMAWTSVGVTWGDEFTARLRALPGGATIPLILVNGNGSVEYIMRILELGGPTEILPSPALHESLLDARNRLLETGQ